MTTRPRYTSLHRIAPSITGKLEDDISFERSPVSSTYPSPIYPTTELAPRPSSNPKKHLSPQDARLYHLTNPSPIDARSAAKASDSGVTQSSDFIPPQRYKVAQSGGGGGGGGGEGSPRRIPTSSSSRSPKTISQVSSAGRFEFASDRSPLQKLELELRNIGSKEGSLEQVPGAARPLSKLQAESLQRSTTVSSRLTGKPSPTFSRERIEENYIGKPNRPVRTRAVHSPMERSVKKDDSSMTTKQGKKKNGSSVFGSYKRSRGDTSPKHMNSTDNGGEIPAPNDEKPPRDSIARLTIEDTELDGSNEELFTEDPEPDYDTPIRDEGMPFTLSETLSSGLIILPHSPDTPFFHMVQNPLLQQPRVVHPFRPGEEAEDRYPKPRKLVKASAASYSTPNLLESTKSEPESELQPSQSTSPLIQYIPSRPVPEPSIFTPKLYIKCGPLLRFVGLRRDGIHPRTVRHGSTATAKQERAVWRGTIMIVTADSRSTYQPPPQLRLFVQPLELIAVDPNGVPWSVSDHGLQSGARRESCSSLWRRRDGERQGKYKEVIGNKLLSERGVTWWRFSIETELTDKQTRIAYRINHGPSMAFWVPARGQSMNMMFHSCNGFSLGINPALFSGPDPMWRDVLKTHRKKPFHVMIGGGDQVYNNAVAEQTTLFKEWLMLKNPLQKYSAKWTPELVDELDTWYLERYCNWFSQGLFGVANSQIPMVNIWDDHDIIDGFGSYPSHFNGCAVFAGLGGIAHKHYLLFQHQTLVQEDESHEPCWIMGASPGPYIAEKSRSLFMYMGRNVAFLGVDCRTERRRDVIVTPETYRIVFDRVRRELIRGDTKHLILLLGVPIAYPRLVWLETLLTSKILDPLKALARMNILGGLLNSFDGGVEILDDLDDHWTAKAHKAERNWFIKQLQLIAAEKSVRITILGGDVHLAGVGRFYSNPVLGLPQERDHRYMLNVISSAIVNAPPPNAMADVLNKRNKIHHLDGYTDEDLIPLFNKDVDGHSRHNKHLMPRRNYCTLAEYDPENSPPETPELVKTAARAGISKFLKGNKKAADRKDIPFIMVQDSEVMRQVPLPDSLEIVLHIEVNQRSPDGITKPYRMILPPLTTQSYEATVPTTNT